MNKLKSYIELLPPSTRFSCIKQGMASEFAVKNASFEKIANAGEGLGNLVNWAMALSLIGGVPTGYAWHRLARSASPNKRPAERELQEKIKFYRNLTTKIDSAMDKEEKYENAV